jgi:ABC-type antimicrobial peptide transport system permease subunit
MAAPVMAAVRQVERQVPLYGVTTLEDRLGNDLAERRIATALLAGFSAVALLMAAIGIYGLIQYSVVARTHEIGVRMAVGARGVEIFRMVIAEGLRLSLTGLVLGVLGAVWLGRAGSSLLFEVNPTDLGLGLVDRYYWVQSPLWLGDRGVSASSGIPSDPIARAERWSAVERRALGQDTLLVLDRR